MGYTDPSPNEGGDKMIGKYKSIESTGKIWSINYCRISFTHSKTKFQKKSDSLTP